MFWKCMAIYHDNAEDFITVKYIGTASVSYLIIRRDDVSVNIDIALNLAIFFSI